MSEDKQQCHVNEAHHSEDFKKSLVSRLNRINGQVKGISGMIERDVYCDDVLHQIMSVEAALRGVKKILLKAHMKSCVVDQLKAGETEVIDELLTTIDKMIK